MFDWKGGGERKAQAWAKSWDAFWWRLGTIRKRSKAAESTNLQLGMSGKSALTGKGRVKVGVDGWR